MSIESGVPDLESQASESDKDKQEVEIKISKDEAATAA